MTNKKNKSDGVRNKQYILDDLITSIPSTTEASIEDFLRSIDVIETNKKLTPIIFQDNKSKAFYVECHILASVSDPLLDLDAVLDPEDQVEYRANRTIQPQHYAFKQMLKDAESGRQFSDLVAEYNIDYGQEKPLKILGGQHRVAALRGALGKGIDRAHGFRIYFDLNEVQRNEIAQISNTNISIPMDLLDRMQETILKSGLRDWCQKVGFLKKNQDFADKKNFEGIITVKMARSFVVNFFEGKKKGYNPEKIYEPYLCSGGSGGVDPVYKKLIDSENGKLWNDNNLIKAGKAFADLNKKQIESISKDPKLKKYIEFGTKATTPAVITAWALLAGALGKTDLKKQAKLFNLSKISKGDPLNASGLSKAKHHTDPETYRGIGARTDKKERTRMAEVFIQYIESNHNFIKPTIIDLALKSCLAKSANQDFEKAKEKI